MDGMKTIIKHFAETTKKHLGRRFHVTVQMVAFSRLLTEPVYQRELRAVPLDRIEKAFNPLVAGFLVVNRRSDGVMALVDAHHRQESAKRLGYKEWIAVVIHGMTFEEEALMWEALNSKRSQSRVVELFKSRHKRGETETKKILRKLHAHGFKLPYEKKLKGAEIHCIQALCMAEEIGVLGPVLTVVRDAWGAEQAAARSPIIGGLTMFLGHPSVKLKTERIIKKLEGCSVKHILNEARDMRAKHGQRARVAQAICDVVNKNARSSRVEHNFLRPETEAQIPMNGAGAKSGEHKA